MNLLPTGSGAGNVIVLPSGEKGLFMTAEPIRTLLPLALPLPHTVIVSPSETKAVGYMSEMATGLGFEAVTVNRTGELLTPQPSAVTEI
jgi:hypothetical protein